MACQSASYDVVLFDKNEDTKMQIIIPQNANKEDKKMAELLQQNLAKSFKVSPSIFFENKYDANKKVSSFFIGNTKKLASDISPDALSGEGFGIEVKEKNIFIHGGNSSGLQHGVYYFIKRFLLNRYVEKNEEYYTNLSALSIENNFSYRSEPVFTYRESYFEYFNDQKFLDWNATHSLNNEWGIWGHNLHKFLSDKALNNAENFAFISGERNHNQYCFSNPDLQKELLEIIIPSTISREPNKKYFAIFPQDNTLVCTCDKCTAKGNTTNNGSPALWSFINSLAKKFPNKIFFAPAYAATQKTAKEKAQKNTGVLISTIEMPKGIALQNQKDFKAFEDKVNSWKNYCPNVFIWDYVVNYTNYFDPFPVLKTFQKDLQWYQQKGIQGVFVEGSDEQYSIFGGLKNYVVSHLLWNPHANLDSLRYAYLEVIYDDKVENVNTFYQQMEESVVNYARPLDIYAGIEQAKKAYLDQAALDLFFYDMEQIKNESKGSKQLKIKSALMALSQIKLEILRSNGIGDDGYARVNDEKQLTINKETNLLLDTLKAYRTTLGIEQISENGLSVKDYILAWELNILQNPVQSKAYLLPYTISSTLNEEMIPYAKRRLTDGAFGFLDYETNWFLSTFDDLKFTMDISSLDSIEDLSFHFLNDPRHGIFIPQQIELWDETGALLKKIMLNTISSAPIDLMRQEFKVNLPELKNVNNLKIKISRQERDGKKYALACDEIIIN